MKTSTEDLEGSMEKLTRCLHDFRAEMNSHFDKIGRKLDSLESVVASLEANINAFDEAIRHVSAEISKARNPAAWR